MLINLSELFSVAGKAKTYHCNLEMDQFHSPQGDYEIVKKDPVVLEIINEGNRVFHLTGKGTVTPSLPCSRCLETVTVRLSCEVG